MNKILKFQADWCQPCKQLTKEMDGLSFPVDVLDIDDEANQQAVANYRIRGVPTLVFLKDGQEVNRTVGLISKEKINYTIEKTYGQTKTD